MASSEHKIQTHLRLTRIIEYLEGRSERKAARKTMAPLFQWSDDILDSALEYGVEQSVLFRRPHNVYELIGELREQREDMFYELSVDVIRQFMRSDNYKEDEFFVENTSKRNTGIIGKWTRPDLVSVSQRRFPWTIGREFDVTTFEIKHPSTCNVLAVFEALAHVSAATKSYAVFPVDKIKYEKSNKEQYSRIEEECAKHGIGLLFIDDIEGDPKFNCAIRARRQSPDFERVSEFLDKILTPEAKKKISSWQS